MFRTDPFTSQPGKLNNHPAARSSAITMNEAEKLKSTLSSIFSRKGRDDQYTRLFENLESPQKHALLSKVQLNEGELPAIGSAERADKWLVITTERIVWRLEGKEQSLSARDVQ